jgi:hypothetical protein
MAKGGPWGSEVLTSYLTPRRSHEKIGLGKKKAKKTNWGHELEVGEQLLWDLG